MVYLRLPHWLPAIHSLEFDIWWQLRTYIATVISLKVVEFISAPLETRLCTSDTPWLLPYSGKLSREKTFVDWWKYDFRGENFRRLLAFAVPKDATPQISQRKFSRIATKPKKSRKFSPSKVFCYMVFTPPKQLYTSHVALLIDCDHLSRTVCPIVYNEYITRPHENHEMYRLVKTCIDTCIAQTKSTCLYRCSHRIGLGKLCHHNFKICITVASYWGGLDEICQHSFKHV